jgi:hypothetical protein
MPQESVMGYILCICVTVLCKFTHLQATSHIGISKVALTYIHRSNTDPCPVTALMAYIAVRGQDPGPLFRLADGTPLLKLLVIKRVQETLSSLAYDHAAYTGHSFQIGAATTAAAAGSKGRWSFLSPHTAGSGSTIISNGNSYKPKGHNKEQWIVNSALLLYIAIIARGHILVGESKGTK